MPTLCLILTQNNTPFVQVQIDKEPVIFCLDTGCSMTTISTKLGQKFRFHSFNEMVSVSRTETAHIMEGTFKIFGKVLYHVQASPLIDAMKDQIGCPHHFGGLLGQDLFSQFSSVEFDYKQKVVRFKES